MRNTKEKGVLVGNLRISLYKIFLSSFLNSDQAHPASTLIPGKISKQIVLNRIFKGRFDDICYQWESREIVPVFYEKDKNKIRHEIRITEE
jgi:hypothetical protein